MLTIPLVTNGDSDNSGSPVSHKSFCTSIENGLTTDGFCTGTVNLWLLDPYVSLKNVDFFTN